MLLLKIAFRNLTRNRVRTFLNLTMVIGAFSSIVLFKGFSNYMMGAFELSVTTGQYGHIQVAHKAIWDGDMPARKEDAYIANSQELRERISKLPGVEHVGARAHADVLISNGEKSTGAWALGFDNMVESSVADQLTIQEGAGFTNKQDFEILVSTGLQEQLHLKVGQTVTLVSQTLSGSVSSIEPEVRGIVRSGATDTDAVVVYLPLPAVQKLLGTSRAERLTVLLKPADTGRLEQVTAQVKELLKNDSDLVTKTFKQIADLYRQSAAFYEVQNLVVELILSCLIFFGILNTVGMSIYERTGELGTMRALGDQRSEVLSLLMLEGLMLGIGGALLGIPTAGFLSVAFSALDVPLLMPGASVPLPIHVTPAWADYLQSGAVVIVTCVLSSLWPSLKAVRISIVDALRANS